MSDTGLHDNAIDEWFEQLPQTYSEADVDRIINAAINGAYNWGVSKPEDQSNPDWKVQAMSGVKTDLRQMRIVRHEVK